MARVEHVAWATPIENEKDVIEHSKYFRKEFIKIAIQALQEEERDGFDKKAKIRTDNKWNVPVTGVKPYGKVEWYARTDATEALLGIYRTIENLSPVRTGRYKASNYVFVGTKMVAYTYGGLVAYLKKNSLPFGRKIYFVNGMPYSRKLERYAVTSKGGKVRYAKSKRNKRKIIRKPNGVYHKTWRAAMGKYKQLGFIDFKLQPNGANGITFPTSGLSDSYSGGKNKKSIGRPYLHPVISVRPLEDGTFQ